MERERAREELARLCRELYGTSDLVECAFKLISEGYGGVWRRERPKSP